MAGNYEAYSTSILNFWKYFPKKFLKFSGIISEDNFTLKTRKTGRFAKEIKIETVVVVYAKNNPDGQFEQADRDKRAQNTCFNCGWRDFVSILARS